MRRSAVALGVALIVGIGVFGAAATLGLRSSKLDTFAAALPATTTTSSSSTTTTTAPGDTTPPALSTTEFYDNNRDGKIEQIKLTYNENLGGAGTTGQWTLDSGRPSGMSTNPSSVQISGPQVLLNWTTLSTAPATAAAMNLTSTATVTDAAGNAAVAYGTKPVTDKAGPIPISLTISNSSGGTVRQPNAGDTITAVYSEPLSAPSVCPGQPAGSSSFSVPNTNDVVQVHFTDNGSADSFTIKLTTCTPGGPNALHFGTVALNGNFVTQPSEFWGNGSNSRGTIALSGTVSPASTSGTIAVTMGALKTGAATQASGATVATYDPDDLIADLSGNTVPTVPPGSSQFILSMPSATNF